MVKKKKDLRRGIIIIRIRIITTTKAFTFIQVTRVRKPTNTI